MLNSIPPEHLRALRVLCERLPPAAVNWALTGSLGHRLQGVDVPVHDIDVQTDAGGAAKAADLLPEYVVDRPRPRESERMSSIFSTLMIADVKVEIMGAVRKRDRPDAAWGPVTDPAEHRVMVYRFGLAIPVLSLAYEATAYEMIGRHERAALLRAAADLRRGSPGKAVDPLA